MGYQTVPQKSSVIGCDGQMSLGTMLLLLVWENSSKKLEIMAMTIWGRILPSSTFQSSITQ